MLMLFAGKKRSNYLVDLHPQEEQSFEKQGGTEWALRDNLKSY
jgi:hypothetical protein